MIQYEAVEGPYSRWLREVKEKLGERVWRIVQDMEVREADVILASKGVVPFLESPHYLKWRLAMDIDAKAPEKYGIVRMVPVVYMEGDIVEVSAEEPDPKDVRDPRSLVGGSEDWTSLPEAEISPQEASDDF